MTPEQSARRALHVKAVILMLGAGVIVAAGVVSGDVKRVFAKPVARSSPAPRPTRPVRIVYDSPDQCHAHGHGHAFAGTADHGTVALLCTDFHVLTIRARDL
jgi:hypothetical protein